jgi:fructose-bisphosphate aldolase class 1
MTRRKLEGVAQTLVAEGKGILAADETVPTLTKRFDALGIRSSRRGRVIRTDQKAGTLRMRELRTYGCDSIQFCSISLSRCRGHERFSGCS